MLDGLQMGLIVTYLFIYFLTNSEMLHVPKSFGSFLSTDPHFYSANQLGILLPAPISVGVLCLGFLEGCGPGWVFDFT